MQKFTDLPGAFVTGSSLVVFDPNDRDIVVPLSSWEGTSFQVEKTKLYVHGPHEYMDDPTIHSTHRCGSDNIIVVFDKYLDPWIKATSVLVGKPEFYQEKSSRVALFERIKTRFIVEKEMYNG